MKLTPRQREVLNAVWSGKSRKDVAALLHITERTVWFHLGRMYEKTGIKNTGTMGGSEHVVRLIRLALQNGILEVQGNYEF